MSQARNGVTTARWNTKATHNVGFFDRGQARPFSEILRAAAEYFEALEADPSAHFYIDDVRYRMGRDGVNIFEVQVLELSEPGPNGRNEQGTEA